MPPLVPVDEPDHVDRLLGEVFLKMVVEGLVPSLYDLVLLAQLLGVLALSSLRASGLAPARLPAVELLCELCLCILIHLLVEVLEQLPLLRFVRPMLFIQKVLATAFCTHFEGPVCDLVALFVGLEQVPVFLSGHSQLLVLGELLLLLRCFGGCGGPLLPALRE